MKAKQLRGNREDSQYYEDVEATLTPHQKYAFTRWAHSKGYRTIEGYLTASRGYEWKDYSLLRELS